MTHILCDVDQMYSKEPTNINDGKNQLSQLASNKGAKSTSDDIKAATPIGKSIACHYI